MAAYTPNSNNINKNDTHVQLVESILRDEYDSINRKIINLQEAHLVVLRTLNPLPDDPYTFRSDDESVRSPSLKGEQLNFYEVASIWLMYQDDADEYCQKLEQAIAALEVMRMDIVKGLINRTTH